MNGMGGLDSMAAADQGDHIRGQASIGDQQPYAGAAMLARRGNALDDRVAPAAPTQAGGTGRTRISPWLVWLASLAMIVLGLAIYGRSLHILPLSDDWEFHISSYLGPSSVFGVSGHYHYYPVAKGLMYAVYLLFGLNPVPYHIVAIMLFGIGAVLVLRVGWKLTGSFTIGVLAGLLYVLSGRQYEAVVWTVVAFIQTLALVFYLSGLLFYLHAQDEHSDRRRRLWMLIGFYVCMVLAVFTYEQEVTLVIVCMLYRLFVIEHGYSIGWRALLARARVWALEFGFPVVFLAAYLAFKYWVSLQAGVSQAPGLHLRLEQVITLSTIGLYQSFTPGIVSGRLLTAQLAFLASIGWGHPLWSRLVSFAKVLAPLGVIIVFGKPVYRWLSLWSLLGVTSTVLGIGYLASRYYMLLIVPAVILWAGFLVWGAKKLQGLIVLLVDNLLLTDIQTHRRRQRMVQVCAWLPMIALVAAYGVLGVQYTLAQEANWQQASDIEGAAIHRIADLGAANPGAHRLYMVNLPDSLPNPADPTGHFEHGAYLFQDRAPDMITLSIPGRFEGVYYLRTPDAHLIGTPRVISRAEVDALATNPTYLVVCFSNRTHQIERWGPLCT
jgi:hypothetical protein